MSAGIFVSVAMGATKGVVVRMGVEAASLTPVEARALAAELLKAARLARPLHKVAYDREGTPGVACQACASAWPEGEPEAHAPGCEVAS